MESRVLQLHSSRCLDVMESLRRRRFSLPRNRLFANHLAVLIYINSYTGQSQLSRFASVCYIVQAARQRCVARRIHPTMKSC